MLQGLSSYFRTTMGAEGSKQDNEGQAEGEQQNGEAANSIKLYKYIAAGANGQWQLMSSAASCEFYDDSTNAKKFNWMLEIDAGDINVRADTSLRYEYSIQQQRITFHASGSIWAMRFPNAEMAQAFVRELEDKVFFNTHGYENDEAGRVKAYGEDFADVFFNCESGGVEPMEADDEHDGARPEDEEQGDDYEEQEFDKAGTPVHGMIMGATDRSYVMRGTQFDVLRNRIGGVEDAGVSFTVTPAKKGTPQFTPGRVLMTNAERNMNILTPDNRSKLFRADVEAQRVVGEFSFVKDGVEIPIDDIVHETKDGQLQEGSTFKGLASNLLCRWDLRDPSGVVQQSPVVNFDDGKQYARNTNFTCIATSGDGYTVVGSKDGKVRLYGSKSMQRANTSIPGLGAPITSVDVTFDGKWVLATTDDYLLVVKTIFTRDGKETNGFKSRMGGNIPLPRLLRLKVEDTVRTGNKPFRNGKFTWVTESGHSERHIVASVGRYSVIWNLNKVKAAVGETMGMGGLPTNMQYMITEKDEEVVDSSFMHERFASQQGVGTPLVVATQHKLFSMAS